MTFIRQLLCCCATLPLTVLAASDTPENSTAVNDAEYKLTLSYYDAAEGNNASDINLRVQKGEHTGWIGRYSDSNGFTQERIGYDNRQDFGWARLISTLELGSGGYAGLAFASELGGKTYAMLGIDRTNLQQFYNLGFDPSDALLIGVGSRAIANTEMSLYQIRENRLDTQRRSTHFYWRLRSDESARITVDVAHKSGIDDAGVMVTGNSISVTYDYGHYFARLAHDPYANFATSSLNRFSVGLRF